MKSGERRDMNATYNGVWKYLTEHVPEDGIYISYLTIGAAVGKKSRHAVAYAVEKLCSQDKIRIYDRKIFVLEAYKDA